ncbi:hypothetical protein HDU98_006528 [Podochytrium sp. JEL0797]|nr:hypothetical protein HDU98_006528 [Podochytrium sp. JEL0797]
MTPPTPPKKWFDRIVITYLENTDYAQALAHRAFSDLNAAPHFGTLLSNYHGVFHPSQPNYIALVVGDTAVKNDVVVDVEGTCVVDLLEKKGVSWGAYCEGYPDDWKEEKPFLDHAVGRYVRRHNPLVSMSSVQNDPKRAKNIKSVEAFKRELEAGTLPEFIYYTPNQDNNAHDTTTEYAARYINEFYVPMMSHPFFTSQRTLFVLTFDESASYLFGGNHVATWLLGTAVKSTPLDKEIGVGYEKADWEWAIPGFQQDQERGIDADGASDGASTKPSKDKPNFYLSNLINLTKVFMVPAKAKEPTGHSEATEFNHYDILKTVELNWGLGNLGRKDVDAIGFGALLRSLGEE